MTSEVLGDTSTVSIGYCDTFKKYIIAVKITEFLIYLNKFILFGTEVHYQTGQANETITSSSLPQYPVVTAKSDDKNFLKIIVLTVSKAFFERSSMHSNLRLQ